jgi:hypothetical protein
LTANKGASERSGSSTHGNARPSVTCLVADDRA